MNPKKEIHQEVLDLLSKGHSHQEVFDMLKEKYVRNGKVLTEVLCKIPIPRRKTEYKWLWLVLLAVLSTLFILRIFSGIYAPNGFSMFVEFFFAGILGFIILSVIKYEKYTFQFLGLLGIVNVVWILRSTFFMGLPISQIGYVSLLMVLIMSVCSYILFYKLYIKHRVEKIPVRYMDGRTGFEITAKFMSR